MINLSNSDNVINSCLGKEVDFSITKCYNLPTISFFINTNNIYINVDVNHKVTRDIYFPIDRMIKVDVCFRFNRDFLY